MDELFRQAEQFIVGGTFIGSILFTRKMFVHYEKRIQKLEVESTRYLNLIHKVDKELTKMSAQVDFISKHFITKD